MPSRAPACAAALAHGFLLLLALSLAGASTANGWNAEIMNEFLEHGGGKVADSGGGSGGGGGGGGAAATTTTPYIKIAGPNPFRVGVQAHGIEYRDVGAGCSDHAAYDDNLNERVSVGGDVVRLDKPGVYHILYYCSHLGRKAVPKARTVIVSAVYNARCAELEVAAADGGSLSSLSGVAARTVEPLRGAAAALLGRYTLGAAPHDGRPVYHKLGGGGTIYYFEAGDGDKKSQQDGSGGGGGGGGGGGHGRHWWAIGRTMRRHFNAHKEEGLRAASNAVRPEEISLPHWHHHSGGGGAGSGGGGGGGGGISVEHAAWQAWDEVTLSWRPTDIRLRCTRKQAVPTPAPHYTIRVAVQLGGLTRAVFGARRRREFRIALSDALGIAPDMVTIESVVDAGPMGGSTASSHHRRLLRQQPPQPAAAPKSVQHLVHGGRTPHSRLAKGSSARVTGASIVVSVALRLPLDRKGTEEDLVRHLDSEPFEDTLFASINRNGLAVPKLLLERGTLAVNVPAADMGPVDVVALAGVAALVVLGLALSCLCNRNKAGGMVGIDGDDDEDSLFVTAGGAESAPLGKRGGRGGGGGGGGGGAKLADAYGGMGAAGGGSDDGDDDDAQEDEL